MIDASDEVMINFDGEEVDHGLGTLPLADRMDFYHTA